MSKYHPPFLPGETYHVYNHANGSDDIFCEEDNYRFFQEKYQKYMYNFVDTLAYCWMKNHFHLMIRVKELDYFKDLNTSKVFKNLGGMDMEEFSLKVSKTVSQRFSNLFNSYTKAFNKKYDRMGSLFSPNVKRKRIDNNSYFTSCIIYIHQNPVLHGFVNDPLDWKFSSYWGIVNGNDQIVKINTVLDWFGGAQSCIDSHSIYQGFKSEFE